MDHRGKFRLSYRLVRSKAAILEAYDYLSIGHEVNRFLRPAISFGIDIRKRGIGWWHS
ncbi:hypothetical protein D3C80_1903120 [compost metagenome]